jgi:hypothetical protein
MKKSKNKKAPLLFHSHQKMEEALGLDKSHVIVDKDVFLVVYNALVRGEQPKVRIGPFSLG